MSRLTEYLAFAKVHPSLFVNPPEGGFTILLDEDEIHRAEAEVGRRLEAQGLPPEWAEVGIAYQDQYYRIFRDAVRLPNGSLDTYIRYIGEEDGTPGVFVFPLYQEQVLLLRHFRHDSRSWHLEIPGGYGVKGQSSEENARRELKEEIEATASRLIPLGHVHLDLWSSSDCVELFYADIESYGAVEDHEGISGLLPVTVTEFERMIRENEITHSATIAAYIRAKLGGLL